MFEAIVTAVASVPATLLAHDKALESAVQAITSYAPSYRGKRLVVHAVLVTCPCARN